MPQSHNKKLLQVALEENERTKTYIIAFKQDVLYRVYKGIRWYLLFLINLIQYPLLKGNIAYFAVELLSLLEIDVQGCKGSQRHSETMFQSKVSRILNIRFFIVRQFINNCSLKVTAEYHASYCSKLTSFGTTRVK